MVIHIASQLSIAFGSLLIGNHGVTALGLGNDTSGILATPGALSSDVQLGEPLCICASSQAEAEEGAGDCDDAGVWYVSPPGRLDSYLSAHIFPKGESHLRGFKTVHCLDCCKMLLSSWRSGGYRDFKSCWKAFLATLECQGPIGDLQDEIDEDREALAVSARARSN
jgi:hypothetical protein